MKVFYTKAFKKDFKNIPQEFQKIAENKLALFVDNPSHPSLGVKKMKGLKSIWEGRITINYRFTFHIEGETYVLRRIGTHDILKREKD